MIDYDDMNETLAQEERELAEEESQRQRELERARLDEEYRKDLSYEECLEGIRRVRWQLMRMQSWVHEDHDKAEAEEEVIGRNLLGLLIGYAFHLIPFPILFAVTVRFHVLAALAFGLLAAMWVVYTVTFSKRVLDSITTYRVMTSKKGTEEFAEENRILTYRAHRERCLQRLRQLQEQNAKLDACEKEVHLRQGLSGTAFDNLQALINVPEHEDDYSDRKVVTWKEFHAWKRRR